MLGCSQRRVYPVRAEHAFPPPADVDSLRAYSLPVQSLLAFVCGPREARGQRPRFARPGGGAASLRSAGRASRGGASLRSAWLNSARCFVHGEHIRGEVYQHWRQDMKQTVLFCISERLPFGTNRIVPNRPCDHFDFTFTSLLLHFYFTSPCLL